jgi:hypothetical protein
MLGNGEVYVSSERFRIINSTIATVDDREKPISGSFGRCSRKMRSGSDEREAEKHVHRCVVQRSQTSVRLLPTKRSVTGKAGAALR